MKSTRNVKYISAFWDILEHDLKRVETSTSYENYIKWDIYYIVLKLIFVFWDILEHGWKKGWNFCSVWKIHQAGDIT